MDLRYHERIIWNACLEARAPSVAANPAHDPLSSFGALSRGSWMNDTNQVTCFTDLLSAAAGGRGGNAPVATVDDAVRTVLQQYWVIQKDRIVSTITKRDASLGAANANVLGRLVDTADFGSYTTLEHLDVLGEAPDAEGLVAGKDHQVTSTIDATFSLCRNRLKRAAGGQRFEPQWLSELGRVLHTLADFFGHSNYVELLLWDLSRRRKNDLASLTAYFNRSGVAYTCEPQLEEGFYTPLPAEGQRLSPREGLYPLLWYADAPAATPLASCVFDLQDTAFTLLSMYARYLEMTQPELTTDQELNCLFAVLDMSGAPIPYELIRSVVGLTEKVRNDLDDIGRGARRFLVKTLIDIGKRQTRNPSVKALLDTTGALLQEYDSKEAAEWARAGRLRYCARAIHLDFAQRLATHASDKLSPLPHHTLLCKDYPAAEPDASLRFELACLLATAVTAKILGAYFSGGSVPDVFDSLCDSLLVHPSRALGKKIKDEQLAALVTGSFGKPWATTKETKFFMNEVLTP
jgi:hypothetical protein